MTNYLYNLEEETQFNNLLHGLCCVLLIFTLITIAMSRYSDYVYKTKIVNAQMLSPELRYFTQEYYAVNGNFPTQTQFQDFYERLEIHQNYNDVEIEKIQYLNEGNFSLTFTSSNSEINQKSLGFRSQLQQAGATFFWICGYASIPSFSGIDQSYYDNKITPAEQATTISPKFLPHVCRR